MPRLPARIPARLAGRAATISSNLIARGSAEIDFAIAGIAFRRANWTQNPQVNQTIQVNKQQMDTEADPGEQSLSNWWRRSQASWHEGAGSLYQEGQLGHFDNNTPNFGFYDSDSIDPFTPGQLQLLRAMNLLDDQTSFKRISTYNDGSTYKLSAISGASLWTSPDDSTAFTALHSPSGKSMVDGFISGSTFYDLASDGTLYKGLVSSPGSATTWPLGGAPTRLLFGKGRLWACGGPDIWQPDTTSAGGTAQDPIFTSLSDGWQYTCVAEGPGAMYFGGHDGRTSSIQSIVLDSSGAVPTLSGAQASVVLPDGEFVQEIAVLAGQFIGIGTSRGMRVGQVSGANITYGPLLFTPVGVTKCTGMTTEDKFFVVSFDSTSEGAIAYRVNTGTILADGVYAYAKDINCAPDGHLLGLTVYGSQPSQTVAILNDGSVYIQHATELCSSGWLKTGRIRFRTTENKLFKYLDLEFPSLYGTLAASVFQEDDTELAVATISTQGRVGAYGLGIDNALGPQVQIAVKLTLDASVTDPSKGPLINSYAVKALPSVRPQRMLQIPLLCYDQETGRSGQRYGFTGYALQRLQTLQAVEDIGDVVSFQDFTGLATLGQSVLIDQITFQQADPDESRGLTGDGGLLIVQLRTVVT